MSVTHLIGTKGNCLTLPAAQPNLFIISDVQCLSVNAVFGITVSIRALDFGPRTMVHRLEKVAGKVLTLYQ